MLLRQKVENKLIYYAGESQQRIGCLQQLPDCEVRAVGGGWEPDIRETEQIVFSKLAYAFPFIFGEHALPDNQAHAPEVVVTAVDTRTEIMGLLTGRGREKVVFFSKGKPKNLEQVRENFYSLLQVAERHGNAQYRVVSTSAVVNGGVKRMETVETRVSLTKESINYLISEQGFQQYLREFSRIHRMDGAEHASQQPNIDISGGLSLSVLVKMGMVSAIDGIPLTQAEEAYHAYRAALFTAAAGFSPAILELIHPGSSDYLINNWPWLSQESQTTFNAQFAH